MDQQAALIGELRRFAHDERFAKHGIAHVGLLGGRIRLELHRRPFTRLRLEALISCLERACLAFDETRPRTPELAESLPALDATARSLAKRAFSTEQEAETLYSEFQANMRQWRREDRGWASSVVPGAPHLPRESTIPPSRLRGGLSRPMRSRTASSGQLAVTSGDGCVRIVNGMPAIR